MVDCCWLKTQSIVFDQVDDGGSFGGVFVSSGIILALFAVFFLMVVRSASFGAIFLLRGWTTYGRGGRLDREGRE